MNKLAHNFIEKFVYELFLIHCGLNINRQNHHQEFKMTELQMILWAYSCNSLSWMPMLNNAQRHSVIVWLEADRWPRSIFVCLDRQFPLYGYSKNTLCKWQWNGKTRATTKLKITVSDYDTFEPAQQYRGYICSMAVQNRWPDSSQTLRLVWGKVLILCHVDDRERLYVANREWDDHAWGEGLFCWHISPAFFPHGLINVYCV